jgi:hypothetical protein
VNIHGNLTSAENGFGSPTCRAGFLVNEGRVAAESTTLKVSQNRHLSNSWSPIFDFSGEDLPFCKTLNFLVRPFYLFWAGRLAHFHVFV